MHLDDYDRYSVEAPIPFPTVVHTTLSSLQCFPNLETVILEFPFKWNNFEDPRDSLDEAETAEQVRVAEERNGWRTLMAQSFNALADNNKIGFQHLELRQLAPYEVSTFNSEKFHKLLNAVKRFSLSLRGWENGAGWNLNTMPAFGNFARKLDTWFFNHLHSVEHLVFEASDTAPIGLDPGRYHAHLALKPDQMPLLRSIKVVDLFVCPELVVFLTAHLQALEELRMYDCRGAMEVDNEDTEGVSWHKFFNALLDGSPSKLRKLVVEWFEEVEYEAWEDVERYEKVCAILRDDPNRILFNYSILDDKYGMVFHDENQIATSFFEGKDQDAYENLVAVVSENRAEGKASTTKPK